MIKLISLLQAYIVRGRLLLYFSMLLLIVVLLLIVPLYITYTDKLESQITEINNSLLKQVQSDLDGLLKEVDRSSIKLSGDDNVKRFIFLEKNELFTNKEDYQLFLKKMYDVLSNEEKIYANKVSIYLYVNDAHQIITSSEAVDLDDFEDRNFVRTALLNSQLSYQWTGKRTITFTRVRGYPSQQDVVTFRRNVSNNGLVTDATLFINVRIDLIKDYVRNFEGNVPMALQIVDSNNLPIYSDIQNMQLDEHQLERIHGDSYNKKDFVRSVVSSKYSQWEYAVVVPKAWLRAPMKFISNMTFLLTVVVLIFGLLVSYYFARRFYRPFELTLKNWKAGGSYRKDGTYAGSDLHSAVKRLVSSTETYGRLLEENQGVIKNRVMLDLLHRNKRTQSELINLNIARSGNYFQVIVGSMDEIDELPEQDKSLMLFAAINIASETMEPLGCHIETAWLDEGAFAVLLSGGEKGRPTKNRLYETLSKLQDNLMTYLKISFTIGVGNAYDSELMLSQSYRESLSAVHHRIFQGKGAILFFHDLRQASTQQIPEDEWLKFKELIISSVRAREQKKLKHAIGQLTNWLQHHPGIKTSHIQYILYSVLMDMEKMIYELNIDRNMVFPKEPSVFALVESCKTLAEIGVMLEDLCVRMVDYLNSKQYSVKSSLIVSVCEYLENNHADENLSLGNLAEHFGMNPSYLGQLLKKELSKTFLQMLSEIRVEKAKEWIERTPLQIQDIAERVGYASRSTFIRVFKNYVGVTPSEFRNRKIDENGEGTEM